MSATRTLLLAAGLAVVASALTTALILDLRPAAAPSPEPISAVPAALGTDLQGEVAESRGAARRYLFQIPQDAAQVDVSVQNADGDVELRAVCGAAAPERDDGWSWVALPEDGRAKLSLTRHAESDLRAGPLLVEVRPVDPAGHHGDARSLPFTLRAEATRLAAPRELAVGRDVDAETDPAAGYRRDFVFDLPAGSTALRIDVLAAPRDLDLLLSSQAPPLDPDAATWKATTPLGRESLLVDAGTQPPLPSSGRLYLAVVDPSLYGAPVKFRLAVTPRADPPAEALVLPQLPRPSDPRARAVAAVVEIVADDGSGSGTLVRDDGLILTARHVVGDRTGKEGDITVAMDLDPTGIARDLFHAEVVASDDVLDLALLRITSGLYGQPLPRGYRFPALPVAFDGPPHLGDPLVTIGFPEAGGTGTRSPVMYSRGVVSGFEHENGRLHLKTDAFVAPGSSGGAAVDGQFRLVGIPVFTMTDSEHEGVLGFLVPVTELPKGWRERIAAGK